MADERLRIIVDAVNEARDELRQVRGDLQGIKSEAGNASRGLGGFVNALRAAGIVAGAVQLARLAGDLAMAGAEAERAEYGFELMTGGVTQAAIYLNKLREVTQGTVSDVELMNQATTIMALGLADDADELARVMRNVSALGARFGGNLQTFQLMMSNQSLMRIDSFGLSVAEVTRRIEEYKRAGVEASEAFQLAVLDAMDAKFQELGGTLDDTITKTERARATFADLKAEIGRNFTGALDEVAVATNGVAEGYLDLLRFTREAREEHGYFVGTLRGFLRVFGAYKDEIDDAELAERALAEASKAAAQGYSDVGASLTGLADRIRDTAGATNEAREAAANAAIAFTDAAAGLQEMTAAQFAKEQLDELKGAFNDGRITAEEYHAAQEAILKQFGILTEAEEGAQSALETLRQAFIDGKITAEQYAAAVQSVKASIDAIPDRKSVSIDVRYNIGQPAIPELTRLQERGERPQAFAVGGFLAPGGVGIVGDRGPEIIQVTPAGARITPVQNISNTWNIAFHEAANAPAAVGMLMALYGVDY